MRWRGLVKELRRRGLTVKVVKGWKGRGRSGLHAVGVMYHHTASSRKSGDIPCVGLVTHGAGNTAPGPLCNFLAGRKGTVVVVAKGKANHGGLGGPYGGWLPKDSANGYTIGVECENDGRGEPWSPEQKEAIALLFAVLLKRMGRGYKRVIGHKEYTTRKPDPAGIDMNKFRTRVRRVLRGIKK